MVLKSAISGCREVNGFTSPTVSSEALASDAIVQNARAIRDPQYTPNLVWRHLQNFDQINVQGQDKEIKTKVDR